jgi:hypothetical protein
MMFLFLQILGAGGIYAWDGTGCARVDSLPRRKVSPEPLRSSCEVEGVGLSGSNGSDQCKKGAEDLRRQFAAVADAEQLVSGAINRQQLGPCGDEAKGCLHLGDGAEAVAGSVDEESRGLLVRKVL